MQLALDEAQKAYARDEVPIGAVLVDCTTGQVLAADSNRTIELKDPSAHAEILVIRKACQELGAQRIPNTALYVTLEPCTMCAAAISFARINHVYIGALDEKGGGIIHGAKFYEQATCHHRPNTSHGTFAEECSGLLKTFFKEKRKSKT